MKFRIAELLASCICLAFAIFLISYDIHLYFQEEALEEIEGEAPSLQKEEEEEEAEVQEEVTAFKEPNQRIVTIPKGYTFNQFLKNEIKDPSEGEAIGAAVKNYFRTHKLQVGQRFILFYTHEGLSQSILNKIIFFPNAYEKAVIQRDPQKPTDFIFQTSLLPQKSKYMEGSIEQSLFVAARKSGAPARIIHQFIRLISHNVDFQRSIRPGDTFKMLMEETYDEETGTTFGGELVYAALVLKDGTQDIYRFMNQDGRMEYYNCRGEGTRKALLKTPVSGARISDVFGLRKKHPVLGYTAMHRGIDFAAPIGTPIMAAGDGVVKRAGRFSSFGNYVLIEHNREYSTAYAHLSRYSKNAKAGTRVRQGDIIGFVGATGRASGPHLHYEVLRYGKQINPQSLRMSPAQKLSGKEFKAFTHQKTRIEKQIQSLRLSQGNTFKKTA
jgi:murein DD-endopeptidase MepM/ murein hydrolase activator NlpD